MAIYKNSVPYGNIVTDGLVLNLDAINPASYPGTGTTWFDTSGRGNNGTLTNGPVYTTQRGQASFTFDGVDDRVTRAAAIDVGDNFTVNAWIYPTLLGTTRRAVVANSYPSSGRIGWFFCTAGFSRNNTFFLTIGGDVAYRIAAIDTLSTNTWQYITGAVTDGGGTIILYKNGQQITSYANSLLTSGSISYTTNEFNVGWRQTAVPDPYTGNIANVQMYNRALSATEVAQNYNALKSRFGY